MQDNLVRVLSRYNLYPKNISFYETAFTHRSFLNESKKTLESNERLEFLGDAILSFIVSSYIYNQRASDTEGDLTNIRAYIVKTDSLAIVSKQLGLGELLKLSKGEETSGGRDNTQLLANTFESLLGAIYMDLGIEAAMNFVHTTLIPIFAKEIQVGAPKDAKSELQELVQSKYQVSPFYKILTTTGPDHAKQFEVGVFVRDEMLGKGEGNSKQTAEEVAAKQAVSRLQGNTL
ncbi:ribonuclease III [Candidatus Daviesbacteria bacterium RIFCSPLOWO2_02_FULL_40_8]|uniref:Ribonuclease 3 n=1 Tax=Candidatus Daviesbacteria bacterium RIFCSPLOWO2_01_FULL_40_24 TaxID=1797787 RepID=A0A1F5MIX0_9BACT|nr:MAG: ribonuclease III [Candidatus Daviesbacteria bacterium RIFCSPHIGHO2_01_FULL_41_45]OGE35549.1 MAG: ribonuclease III [Candidatus Daviesbacteria bacterium RIFCSPHIGHO2_02_FULL_41_14]OGE65298.1 MAG: ribonuclease III [Candidatus Daviesbacteria bacterium RIFCSPLOWO2_01_FULL_40_24]OGE66946.1 MAG: ribonuclease III [Candidatus Daviesbacteria bacterium RIFCSPLOWO2_02_FULL_40_8]